MTSKMPRRDWYWNKWVYRSTDRKLYKKNIIYRRFLTKSIKYSIKRNSLKLTTNRMTCSTEVITIWACPRLSKICQKITWRKCNSFKISISKPKFRVKWNPTGIVTRKTPCSCLSYNQREICLVETRTKSTKLKALWTNIKSSLLKNNLQDIKALWA